MRKGSLGPVREWGFGLGRDLLLSTIEDRALVENVMNEGLFSHVNRDRRGDLRHGLSFSIARSSILFHLRLEGVGGWTIEGLTKEKMGPRKEQVFR